MIKVMFRSAIVGCIYFFMQEERDVMDLLSKCGQDYTSRDSYYYKISSRRMRAKEVGRNSAPAFYDTFQVQIIPWVISDSNYVKCAAPRLDPQVGKTNCLLMTLFVHPCDSTF